jgi:hypothetical protein
MGCDAPSPPWTVCLGRAKASLQAAILGVKLRCIDAENARRRVLADRYDLGLAGLHAVKPARVPEGCRPSRHLYPVRLREAEVREKLQRTLAEHGIETLIHYPILRKRSRPGPPGRASLLRRAAPQWTLALSPMYSALLSSDDGSPWAGGWALPIDADPPTAST